MTIVDALTGTHNKRYFIEFLDREMARCARYGRPLSLVMFDIDHFKKINDTHGHLAGDYALSTLAKVVSDTIRQEDVFARYGGEEFAVICRGIDLTGAVAFGERIRRCVDGQAFIYNGVDIKVTVSVGVAAVADVGMKEPSELIGAADDALYQAKRQGRNRVISGNAAAEQAR
jgi:diguanylate cyclase (GGDEF)-like protein